MNLGKATIKPSDPKGVKNISEADELSGLARPMVPVPTSKLRPQSGLDLMAGSMFFRTYEREPPPKRSGNTRRGDLRGKLGRGGNAERA